MLGITVHHDTSTSGRFSVGNQGGAFLHRSGGGPRVGGFGRQLFKPSSQIAQLRCWVCASVLTDHATPLFLSPKQAEAERNLLCQD